eukprot:324931_1
MEWETLSKFITNYDSIYKQKDNKTDSSLNKLIFGFIREFNEKELKTTRIPSVINDLIINFIPCLIISWQNKSRYTYANYNYLPSDTKLVFGLIKLTNSWITCDRFERKKNKGGKLLIQCLGECIIDKDSSIEVSERGYENGYGSETSGGSYRNGPIRITDTYNDGGGGPGACAGYGSNGGGKNGGKPYGDKLLNILHLGSGGGCNRSSHVAGKGGGAIYLETNKLVNNGSIIANGGSGNCCGSGSGGSIHIITNKFIMGNEAKIEAIGGHTYNSKAGVGRIRIEMKDNQISNKILKQINPKPYVG